MTDAQLESSLLFLWVLLGCLALAVIITVAFFLCLPPAPPDKNESSPAQGNKEEQLERGQEQEETCPEQPQPPPDPQAIIVD